MILDDNPGDPTMECVEIHPDELVPLEKGSDGMRSFRTKRSKLKLYTPRKQLFAKKILGKGLIYFGYFVRIKTSSGSKR